MPLPLWQQTSLSEPARQPVISKMVGATNPRVARRPTGARTSVFGGVGGQEIKNAMSGQDLWLVWVFELKPHLPKYYNWLCFSPIFFFFPLRPEKEL